MRRRLFWLSLVALYAAPVAAGAFGAGWIAVPSFAAVFLLFNALMERVPPDRALAAVSIVVLLALSLVLLAAGWGARSLFEVTRTVPLPLWLGLAVSATLLTRVAWPPRLDRELGAFLDEATETLEGMAQEIAASEPEAYDTELLNRMEEALDALPRGATPRKVDSVMRPLLDEAAPGLLFDAALARASAMSTPRDRHAALAIATDPEAAEMCLGSAHMARLFPCYRDAAELPGLARYAAAAHSLLDEMPAAHIDFPDTAALAAKAETVRARDESLATAYDRLAERIAELDREDLG